MYARCISLAAQICLGRPCSYSIIFSQNHRNLSRKRGYNYFQSFNLFNKLFTVNEGVSNINTRSNELPTANDSQDMHDVGDEMFYNGLPLRNHT
jgi:hypothetical protein